MEKEERNQETKYYKGKLDKYSQHLETGSYIV